jgi:hypothetical protein
MSKIFVPLIILVMPLTLFSQRHGFLKYGTGPSRDMIQFESDDSTAAVAKSNIWIVEFLYDQQINRYLSVEGGIRSKILEGGIGFFDSDTTYFGLAANHLVFPLHIKARVSFLKKFQLTGGIGTSMVATHSFNGLIDWWVAPWQDVTVNKKYPEIYFTFDVHGGLEYILGRSWKASIEFTYCHNPKTQAEATLYNNYRDATSRVKMPSSFGMYSVGIAYRLSNIWIKEKKKRSQ